MVPYPPVLHGRNDCKTSIANNAGVIRGGVPITAVKEVGMIRSQIIGTGHFLPEKVLTNKDLEQFVDTTDEWIVQRTGIQQRHMANDGEGASDLGAPAALRAIASAGLTPEDIDLILCCTMSPDYLFPSTACLIQSKIGASRAAAMDVNAACSGFLYGLSVANAHIQSGQYKTALVIGSERVTNILNWERRDTAVLFGDGAGAVVLRAAEGDRGILSMFLGADGTQGNLLIREGGGSKYPITPENYASGLRDIIMKGQDLFRRAVVVFGGAVQKALEQNGMTSDDLDVFIPHQANVRIIMAAAERVGLPEEKVYLNINRTANTTSASIPIALDQACAEGRIREGSIVLVASFGAGLTWGSSIIRW